VGNGQWSSSPGLALAGALRALEVGSFQPLCSPLEATQQGLELPLQVPQLSGDSPGREEAGGFVPSLLWCRVMG